MRFKAGESLSVVEFNCGKLWQLINRLLGVGGGHNSRDNLYLRGLFSTYLNAGFETKWHNFEFDSELT